MWKCKICEALNRDENCTGCGAHWTTGESIPEQETPTAPWEKETSLYPEQPYTYHTPDNNAPGQVKPKEESNNALIITIVICVTIIVAMLLGIGAYIFVQDDEVVYPTPSPDVSESTKATSIPTTVSTSVPTQAPTPVPTSATTPAPTPTPAPTKDPAEAEAQRDAFLYRASSIASTQAAEENEAQDQSEMNQAAYHAYEMWDALLNDVYQYLKKTLPAGEFERLKKEEVQWIKMKEAEMDAAEAEFENGSAATMVRYGAGASYTRDRCYELIDMIK